ncbi:MAG TPA: T9SS type A sorting domain-containing protein, partial [Cytophagales bacterium]|nr:T9SS type A sorting domain-containing protein [Cytophagales bacterium]
DKVVHIQGTIAIPSGGRITIQNQSGKSIIGLPGSKLTSSDQSKSSSGILYLKTSSNIIMRNVTFQGPGSKDVDGYDLMTIEGGDHIWIDHCDFIDGLDGNFDIKRQANYIAVTWCKFSYTSKSSNHQFSNLIGHDDSFTADKNHLKITFQYNWWADGVVERMPRVRFGQVHVVNNYFSSTKADYNIAAGVGADILVENNFFGYETEYIDLSKSDGNTKVTAKGNSPNVTTSKGTATTPPYSLQKSEASAVKALVTGACGAGATITSNCNCLITALDDQSSTLADLVVYPNPSKQDFSINLPTMSTITILDSAGQLIESIQGEGKKNFGHNYKEGFYIVQIKSGATSKSYKIVKE